MTNIHIEDGVPPQRPEKSGLGQLIEKFANTIINFLNKPEPRSTTEEEMIEKIRGLNKLPTDKDELGKPTD